MSPRGPAHLTVALAGLLQDTQCVVGPLPFAVELNPSSQPIILYLAGREAGQREGRQDPERGRKAQRQVKGAGGAGSKRG